MGKKVEEIYQKKTQLEHILLRPDTYIGSCEPQLSSLWTVVDGKMVFKQIKYTPGLYKIFDEIIVNAADNKVRDPKMDSIKVEIDRENCIIKVANSGRGIPVEMHSKEGVYVPELIFGHLLTSSNYDDDEEKVTGGRNGYGAKLCNIFSHEFIVETADKASGLCFKQVFSKNMSRKSEPKITKNSKNEEYTRISFKPDLSKFGMESIDDDFYGLLVKRVYDLAGCVAGIKVFLNGERIKLRGFKEYCEMYLGADDAKHPMVYERISDRWEVAFSLSDGQFNQVSFVNSICTIKGGTHCNVLADQIVAQLIEAVKKKDKKGVILKAFQVKSHLWMFVNSSIVNPTFDSQTKETLTLRASAFGSKPVLGEDFMKKVLKSGVVESVLSFAKYKQDQLMKKTDGAKRSRISGLTKLDDANNAGTKNAAKCTLILTEGDSAKSLAVSGLSIVGRDNFGVFPLRGKLLNVRDAAHSQIMANAEISAIKQILGLQQGKVYKDTTSLRYGHLMIMTDQDYDGSHIKGLIINFFDHFWPSLLTISGFLLEFITPIVKATKGKNSSKKEVSFFTIPEYEVWKSRNDDGKGWILKYYKGLGTSTTEDAKKYFSDLEKHLKPFAAATDESRVLIDMAFSKKKTDDRKEWLRGFQQGTFMDHSIDEIPLTDFVNKELILFSMADNIRSIPCSVDGFKPGQRKILFACFKRNLKSEIKVAQLAGYVSEHSAYHHGEISLCQTVVNMAQTFVGSNNLNLLEPLGQFGTRLQGGKDAASPRYIFTNLSSLARTIFHPHDDPLLNYLNDDGQCIEPEWYIPVVPMLLINGGEGIGTGWSTAIPNYNPRDVVNNIVRLLDGKDMEAIHPWYRGFHGEIEQESTNKYRVSGRVFKIDDTTVEVTELPLRSWTQNYKELLESWVIGSEKSPAWVKDYKEYHTDTKVHFVITLTEANMKSAEKEGLELRFKVHSSISTTNLVCHDLEGRIKKYDNVLEIIRDFFELRQKYYHKRKLSSEHMKIDNRVRFVMEIIKGIFIVQNRKRADLLEELKEKGYDPIFKGEEAGSSGGFDYLLSMPIWNLTMEKVQSLVKEMEEKAFEIALLVKTSAMDLWRVDLEAFLAKWESFEDEMNILESSKPNNNTTSRKKKRTVDAMIKRKNESGDESDTFVPIKKEIVKPKIKALKSQISGIDDDVAMKSINVVKPRISKVKIAATKIKKESEVSKKAIAIDSEATASEFSEGDDADSLMISQSVASESSDDNKLRVSSTANIISKAQAQINAKSKSPNKSKVVLSESDEYEARVRANKSRKIVKSRQVSEDDDKMLVEPESITTNVKKAAVKPRKNISDKASKSLNSSKSKVQRLASVIISDEEDIDNSNLKSINAGSSLHASEDDPWDIPSRESKNPKQKLMGNKSVSVKKSEVVNTSKKVVVPVKIVETSKKRVLTAKKMIIPGVKIFDESDESDESVDVQPQKRATSKKAVRRIASDSEEFDESDADDSIVVEESFVEDDEYESM